MNRISLLPQKTSIPGLRYIENYLSPEQENLLIKTIDEQQWLSDLKRRVQHYGYKYDYRNANQVYYLGLIPKWLIPLCDKLVNDGIKDATNQVIINEYLPGQGISQHVDCIPCFNDVICSLSLGSACSMEFIKEEKLSVFLDRRSLLILSGEARYNWKHGIAARKYDLDCGVKVMRSRRISITFRTVIS